MFIFCLLGEGWGVFLFRDEHEFLTLHMFRLLRIGLVTLLIVSHFGPIRDTMKSITLATGKEQMKPAESIPELENLM